MRRDVSGRLLKKEVALKVSPAEIKKAQAEGLAACDYKYNYGSWKPFTLVRNNVKYLVYLEYGVRKGTQKQINIEKARLSAVSKQNKGWIRRAHNRWFKEITAAIKTKDRKAIGGLNV